MYHERMTDMSISDVPGRGIWTPRRPVTTCVREGNKAVPALRMYKNKAHPREIHFYADADLVPDGIVPVHYMRDVESWLESGTGVLHTSQACVMDTAGDLLDNGCRVFLHDRTSDGNSDTYELRLGGDERTGKDLRKAHNFYRLWRAGAFWI